MELPEDPLTWDPQQVCCWLKAAFEFTEDTLELFIQNDVDGRILLSEMDHEALKNEFSIASFGKRCNILKQIQTLRGQVTQALPPPTDSPSITIGRDMEALRLVSTSVRASPHTSASTTKSSNARPSQRDYRERKLTSEESEEIRLLAQPLRLWFDEEPPVHQQPSVPRKKQNTQNKKSPQYADDEDESGVSIDSSDDADDDNDDDSDEDEDESSTGDSNDDETTRDLDVHGHNSLNEEDEPLAKKLLERKENEPLAKRMLQRQKLRQDTGIPPFPPTPNNFTPQPQPSGSGSGLGFRPTSGSSTIKKRIAPVLVKPGIASPSTTQRHSPTLPCPTPSTQPPGAPSRTKGNGSNAVARKNHKTESQLAKIGLSLQDIFFNKDGSALNSDDEDSWTLMKSRTARVKESSLYRETVQTNMRRILRAPPIFEVPGHLVYAPVRKLSHKDVPVRVISTTQAEKNFSVTTSTWDSIFRNSHKDSISQQTALRMTAPQMITINIGEQDLTSINFGALTKGLNRNSTSMYWSGNKDDDIVYPLYGDSDASEYTTDEELYNEVAKEDKEREKREDKRSGRTKVSASKVSLSSDAVEEIARIYISDRKETWARVERPKLSRNTRKFVKNIVNKDNKLKHIDQLKANIITLSRKRLVSLLEAMVETAYRNATEVRKACKSLDETIDLLCHEQWKHDILCEAEPIPDDQENSGSETKPSPPTSTTRREPRQGPTSALGSGETVGASETNEEAEERRQRELDAAFIDDTDLDYDSYVDIDDHRSGEDADGDISMEERIIAKPRRSAKMPSSSSPRPTKSRPGTLDHRNVSATPDSLSLPTPPFTATSPQDPPPLSDLDITGDDAEHPGDGSDDSAPISARLHKAKKMRTMTQAPSPILIDLDDDDLEPATRSTSPSKKSTKIKSTPSKPRFKTPRPVVKKELEQNDVSLEYILDSSDDTPKGGSARSKSNTGGRVSPQEADTIPKSLVTAITLREDGDDSDVADIPQPATNVKSMKRPNWREELKAFGMTDSQLIAKLREIGKSAHLGLNVVREEPYISVWQEYIEWIELDGGDSVGIKEFLAWKDEGNTTQVYREMAREAAKTQAATDKAAALKARKEKKLQEEQEAHERKARAQKKEKERVSQETLSMELEGPFSESGESPQRSRGKEKVTTRRTPSTHPETITIDSSDTDSHQEHSRSPSKSTTKSSSRSKQLRARRSQNESESEGDAGSESASDKDSSDSEGQGLEMNFKKRTRAVRNRFDDESPEISSSDERPNASSQPKPRPKRRVPATRDEAQDVLLLRQNVVKNELEYQKRIKDQEQRAKIRGAVNPLLGDEVLINPGHKKTERAVVIPPFLAVNLKPHQIDGLRFMWKNIVMFDGGCILAHSMGLGKTFQVVAFIYVLLTEIHSGNKNIPEKLQPGRVLLLMPPIVLQNWVDEFDKWIPPKHRKDVNVYRLVANNSNMQDRMAVLEKWHADGGVFLVGYNMFRELSTNTKNNTLRNENTAKRFKELLLSPGPSLIFADEGHTIKNKKAKLSVAAKEIKSTARVILTGYPLQNRLEEYWCMVDFVRPKFLDDLATFRFNYIRPISDGLHIDSTELEKKISSKKLKVLTELIKNFVMRKDQSILRASLPKKYEFVISCKLSKWQYHLYTQILPTFGGSGTGAVLGNGHLLLTICNHPAAFKAATKDIYSKRTITPVKTASIANSPSTAPSSASGAITILDESDEEPGDKEEKMVEALSQNKGLSQETWFGEVHQNNVTDVSHGHKVKIVIDIIRACRAIDEKVLVFSRSIPTLDYLEYATNLAGFKSLMLDGSTPIPERQSMINDFNSKETYDLFLISSGAGSQGVNLVSASRVIIFDVGWNPSHDEQAIARAFRYGQTRKVFVYRLQTFGTWEDKLYKTNLHKLGLSNRVVDKKTIHQAHSKTEMKAYFEPPPAPENNPRWTTEENVTALFDKPDADDTVLRSVIQDDIITHIVPQSELVREVDSDLSEADMIDIHRMIAEEERRIKWAEENPGVPIPILSTPGLGTAVRPVVVPSVLLVAFRQFL
ncbi:hypothetical protein BGW39_011677 [Mortierella sp. 14UC]|nr:hypothetical protein BGW39_011677 [Mortierella sp. 14UC]